MIGSDFIVQLKYSNTLPEIPSGPYLLELKPLRDFEEYGKYSFSSLERNHIWQPHFGPTAGIKLDLQDQDSVLSLSKEEALDPSDIKYLAAANSGKILRTTDKPWWLRNTTYSENTMESESRIKPELTKPNLQRSVSNKANEEVNLIDQSFYDALKIKEGASDEVDHIFF